MLERLMCFLAEKPGVGVSTWFGGWIASFLPEIYSNKFLCFIQFDIQVRDKILWCFQIGSLFIGSIAGILTIITLVKKLSNNHKNYKNVKTKK